MESDSGQYLCAVQVHPSNKNTAKGNWKDLRLCRYKASKAEKQLLILMVLRMLWDVVRRRTRIHEEFYQNDPDHEESTTSVGLHAAARLNDGSGASEDTKHIHDEDYLLFLKG
ncbi:hypothetical protein SRHO_G00304600 [Serrasalmus rhombeus]